MMPNQRGPTCGLYALVAVARAIDPIAFADLYATHGDRGANVARDNTQLPSLRYIAKNTLMPGGAPISVIGEVFSGQAMVALANAIGLSSQVVSNTAAWTPLIKSAIDKGRYLLAPFGVGDDGKPQQQGNRPHWCILYGYKEHTFSQTTVYATHWGRTYEFGSSNIRKSSLAMQPFQQTWQKIAPNLKFAQVGQNQVPVHAGGHLGGGGGQGVQGGGGPHLVFNADLPNDLAGQLVEVW
jgi:hypothetical protein